MGIYIMNGGILTTVQDLGRFSYQQQGVSPGGAMDSRSFRLANYLVGNWENEAGLEVTLLGPQIRFTTGAIFAVTGADLTPCLNDAPVNMYQAIRAKKGDVLSFRGLKSGCRSYIAFAGGLDVQPVMGSRATLLRGAIGGYQGRKLKAGDEIGFRYPNQDVTDLEARHIPQEDFSADTVTLRVLLGPQDDRFTEEAIQTLLRETYTVTPQSDRMGYRLDGPKLQHKTDANIITDGIALGSIQVPGSGKPIIMMAERQSTGGYTKIANVISVDIPKLSQCKVGAKLYFQLVTLEQAHKLYRQQHDEMQKWKKRFGRGKYLEVWKVIEEDEFSIKLETVDPDEED